MEKLIKSPSASSKPDSTEFHNKKLCKICGDRAAGNYYGALVCDGCKCFFRRAVLGTTVYKCRFQRNCIISKDGRTQCRHCRLRKCLKAGMKKEAIQSDRDPLKYRRLNEETSNTLTMTSLLHADELIKQPSNLSLGAKALLTGEDTMSDRKVATLKEYLDAMKGCLLIMVMWANSIQAFCELSQDDKVALLRAHAGEYTILSVTRRSLHLNDFLLMSNGFLLTREHGVLGVTDRIIDELVLPFRRLNMDDTEFALLKGILFFDPTARGLSEPKKIEELRDQAQLLLEDYIRDRQLESEGRFGNMLLRLLSLQSIAQAMNEEMQYRELFGIAPIDKLLRQMLLGEDVKFEYDSEMSVIVESSSPDKGSEITYKPYAD